MIRIVNDDLGRSLHYMLYKRLLSFCEKYTPEVAASSIVEGWLSRLYNGDASLHVLVNMEASAIVEHAVIEVQRMYDSNIIVCHQCERDKPNMKTLEEGIEYIDKLAESVNACAKIMFVSHGGKALAKRFGYSIVREMLVKYVHDDMA